MGKISYLQKMLILLTCGTKWLNKKLKEACIINEIAFYPIGILSFTSL